MGFSRCAENPANLLYRAQISLMDALDSKPLTIVPFSSRRNN